MRDELICVHCGEVYDYTYRDEVCAECGEDLVPADKCPFCGEFKPKDEMFCELCEEQLASPEAALAAADGAGDYTEVRVNGFAVQVLGVEGIREAIEEAVKACSEARKKAREYMTEADPEGYVEDVANGYGGYGKKYLPKR